MLKFFDVVINEFGDESNFVQRQPAEDERRQLMVVGGHCVKAMTMLLHSDIGQFKLIPIRKYTFVTFFGEFCGANIESYGDQCYRFRS